MSPALQNKSHSIETLINYFWKESNGIYFSKLKAVDRTLEMVLEAQESFRKFYRHRQGLCFG